MLPFSPDPRGELGDCSQLARRSHLPRGRGFKSGRVAAWLFLTSRAFNLAHTHSVGSRRDDTHRNNATDGAEPRVCSNSSSGTRRPCGFLLFSQEDTIPAHHVRKILYLQIGMSQLFSDLNCLFRFKTTLLGGGETASSEFKSLLELFPSPSVFPKCLIRP